MSGYRHAFHQCKAGIVDFANEDFNVKRPVLRKDQNRIVCVHSCACCKRCLKVNKIQLGGHHCGWNKRVFDSTRRDAENHILNVKAWCECCAFNKRLNLKLFKMLQVPDWVQTKAQYVNFPDDWVVQRWTERVRGFRNVAQRLSLHIFTLCTLRVFAFEKRKPPAPDVLLHDPLNPFVKVCLLYYNIHLEIHF